MPTKKKQSKKLKFSNVTGRKKVMLITLLVFVAIGAGVIIRSFAAVTSTSTYTITNGYLQSSTGSSVVVDSTSNTKTPGQSVLVVRKDGVIKVGSQPGAYINIPAKQNFRLCIDMKDAPAFWNTEWKFGSGQDYPTINYYDPVNLNNGYKQWCSTPIIPDNSAHTGPITITFTKNSQQIYVSTVYIKFVDDAPATTPTPTK